MDAASGPPSAPAIHNPAVHIRLIAALAPASAPPVVADEAEADAEAEVESCDSQSSEGDSEAGDAPETQVDSPAHDTMHVAATDTDDSDLEDSSDLTPSEAAARQHRLACTRCSVEHKRLAAIEPLGRVQNLLFDLCQRGALTEQAFKTASDDLKECTTRINDVIRITQTSSLLELVLQNPLVLTVAPPALWLNRRFFKRLIAATKKSKREFFRVLAKCIVDDERIPRPFLRHFFFYKGPQPDLVTRSVWLELRKKEF